MQLSSQALAKNSKMLDLKNVKAFKEKPPNFSDLYNHRLACQGGKAVEKLCLNHHLLERQRVNARYWHADNYKVTRIKMWLNFKRKTLFNTKK